MSTKSTALPCTDALWHIFISPKDAQQDKNSLMQFVALNQLKETIKIGTNPWFQQMHEVILHNGLALWLDCWWVETEKCDAKWDCLDAFAKSKYSLETIEEISNHLAINYVGGADIDVFGLRGKPAAERDCQKENMLLLHQYLLLYEEMSYA